MGAFGDDPHRQHENKDPDQLLTVPGSPPFFVIDSPFSRQHQAMADGIMLRSMRRSLRIFLLRALTAFVSLLEMKGPPCQCASSRLGQQTVEQRSSGPHSLFDEPKRNELKSVFGTAIFGVHSSVTGMLTAIGFETFDKAGTATRGIPYSWPKNTCFTRFTPFRTSPIKGNQTKYSNAACPLMQGLFVERSKAPILKEDAMKRLHAMSLAGSFLLLFSLFMHQDLARGQGTASSAEINRAVAVLHPTEGNTARGVVYFSKVSDGVRIVAQVSGLKPGKHGFHIHQFGDCSAPDGTSAGGHYNPVGLPHAGPDVEKRHVGDLGNIVADAEGFGTYDRVDKLLQLNGPESILGRAVVVHLGEDDYLSQPTGNAGARAGCGVIGIAKD